MSFVLVIFSSIVPLIVYLKPVLLDGNIQILFSGIKYAPDFFNYYKSLLILISMIVGLIIFFYQRKYKDLEFNKINILIIIYTFLIIISTVFSDHIKVSLFGFYNLFEGCFVLIAYLLMFYFATLLENNKIRLILTSIIVSSTIISIIGISQFLGFDIFNTNIFRSITMGNKFMEISDMLEIKIDKYSIYSTLSNPNYVGSYMAMLFPISIGFFICTEENYKKLILGLFSTNIFLNLLGSGSKAGYLGIFIAMLVLLLLFRDEIRHFRNELLFLIFLLFGFSLIIFMTIDGNITEKVNTLYKSDIGNQESEKIVKDIKYIKNGIQIETHTELIQILLIENEILFYDNLNQSMNLVEEDNIIKIDDNRFKDYEIEFILDDNIVLINKHNTKFRLIADPEYGIRLLNYKGDVITDLDVNSFGFNDKEKFASSRGYLWSRSLPILKDNILIGSGPDTFALNFPQDDIVGKYKVYGTDEILVNKPHNMYLQIAINTGLLSLVCFFVIIISYILSSVKSIKRDKELSKRKTMKIFILLSIISYLVAGIFNDSVVGVAPVFWTVLGIGVNMNYKSSTEVN